MENTNKAICEFQKNANEVVRASVNVYKGKEYLDLRVFYRGDDDKYYATKKGITVNADLIRDLETAVRKLREAVDPE